MTEVADLADTYEGAVARLHHLTEQASTARAHLAERRAQGEAQRAALQQAQAAVMGHLTALEGLLQSTQDHLASDHFDAVASLEQVETTAEAQRDLIAASGEHLESVRTALQTAVQSAQDTLQAGQDVTGQHFTQCAQDVTELEQQTRTAQAQVHGVFQALGEQIERWRQQAAEFDAETATVITHLGEQLADLQTTQVTAQFEALETQIEQQRSNLVQHFTTGASALTQACQGLSGQVTMTATDLTQHITDVLRDLEQYCGHRLQDELRHTARQVVEALLTMLLHEIGDSAALMLLGAQTTSAMGPALPYIAAAKVFVTSINDVLDFTGGILCGNPCKTLLWH